MQRRLRIVVAVLLAVALPLQGIAAIRACFCAGQEAAVVAHEHAGDHGAKQEHSTPQKPSHHCGPCAACCAVALAAEAMLALPFEPAAAPLAFDLPAATGLRPDLPDRPPLLG